MAYKEFSMSSSTYCPCSLPTPCASFHNQTTDWLPPSSSTTIHQKRNMPCWSKQKRHWVTSDAESSVGKCCWRGGIGQHAGSSFWARVGISTMAHVLTNGRILPFCGGTGVWQWGRWFTWTLLEPKEIAWDTLLVWVFALHRKRSGIESK